MAGQKNDAEHVNQEFLPIQVAAFIGSHMPALRTQTNVLRYKH